jgi:hypothetical protein
METTNKNTVYKPLAADAALTINGAGEVFFRAVFLWFHRFCRTTRICAINTALC